MKKRIIVTGATGLAGSELIRQAILDDDIEKITALVRRPLPLLHAKLDIIRHDDFSTYTDLRDVFSAHDACLWCLGISQTQVKEAEYVKITYEYAVTAAQTALGANPEIAFLFLSGLGADSKEKSPILFARIKGKTENHLKRLPFKKLYIARPGGIIPVHKKGKPALYERFTIPFMPLIDFLLPATMITSVDLAKAMLDVIKKGSDKVVLGNMDLKRRAGL